MSNAPDPPRLAADRAGALTSLADLASRVEGRPRAEVVAALRADQRSRWLSGQPLSVEIYCDLLPSLRDDPDSLLELICVEAALSEELGRAAGPAELCRRFPDLADRITRWLALEQTLADVSTANGGPAATAPPDTQAPGADDDLTTEALGPAGDLTHDSDPSSLPPVSGRTPVRTSPASLLSDMGGDATIDPGPAAGAEPDWPAIPGFEIERELGRGGMGVVYQARQKFLNRTVALKMVRAGDQADYHARVRFLAEAEVIAALQHPNIVQVYEFGNYQGCPYFALEYVPGGSLDKKLAGTPQPPAEAAALVETLARAVHTAHLTGVVHRDLKPSNILLASDRLVSGEWSDPPPLTTHHSLTTHQPKIADFGLARRVEAGPGLTQTGAILGTPSYMAPEQAAGHKAGPVADVYSLGALLYECLTGRPPFRATTTVDTLMMVLNHDPVSPRRLQPTTPRDLETICLKCLHKDAARRYRSAEALADDLRRFQAGEPIAARPPTVAERAGKFVRRHRTGVAVAAASLALTAALAAGGLWLDHRARQNEVAALVGPGRRLLDEAEAAAPEEADPLFEQAAQKFAAAQAIDPHSPAAADGLFNTYLRRGRRAAGHGQYDAARVLVLALRTLDRAGARADEVDELERQALGLARWRLTTVPPGVAVTLVRLDDDLQPGRPQPLGPAPLIDHPLAPGDYLVTLTHPGYAELRYPLRADRGADLNVILELLRPGQVPEGMAYVPPGPFLFGDARTGESRRVELPGYFIDRTEVTGADYEKFVQATGAPPPEQWKGPRCPEPLRGQAVYNVSWFDAAEYARWAGKRLPTELEWEKAARGADGRPYPWGARFDPSRCTCRDSLGPEGLLAGRRRYGASPYGCLDMAGNVWEWTRDRERRDRADRVIRGGAAYSTADQLLTSRRQGAPPGGSDVGGLNLLGFRCVKPLRPEPAADPLADLTSRDDLDGAAEFYAVRGKFDRVRALAERLRQLNPRSVPGNFWAAVCRERAGQSREALAAAKVAFAQEPNYRARSGELRRLLADLLDRVGAPADREVLKVPQWLAGAAAALDAGRPAEAGQLLQRVLALDPDHAEAAELLAQVRDRQEKPAEAAALRQRRAAAYRAAAREDPENAELLNAFAEFLQHHNLEPAGALELARRATELAPHAAAYRKTYAELLAARGRWPEAVTEMKRATELAPDVPAYHEALRAYQRQARGG